jgi:hypothetical protein
VIKRCFSYPFLFGYKPLFEMPTTLGNIREQSKTWHSRVLSFGVPMFLSHIVSIACFHLNDVVWSMVLMTRAHVLMIH